MADKLTIQTLHEMKRNGPRIYVSYSLVGYHAALLDKAEGPTAAKFIFDMGKDAIAGVHAGTFES